MEKVWGIGPATTNYLWKMGIRTVVNLRLSHSERTAVEAAGMRSIEIPMDTMKKIDPAAVRKALSALTDPANQPVFVHCTHGKDRTGVVVAVYRLEVDGWREPEAEAEMEACGFSCPDYDERPDEAAAEAGEKERDRLLGISNRGYFDKRLRKEFQIAAHLKIPLALLMLDIDHFKKFNDTYGHQVGDEVLRCAASLVKRAVKQKGAACRYGGEELAVILPAYTREEAWPLAERLRREMEAYPFISGGQRLQITVSVGLGCFAEGMRKMEDLVRLADRRLYEAKKGGRNRVVG